MIQDNSKRFDGVYTLDQLRHIVENLQGWPDIASVQFESTGLTVTFSEEVHGDA